MIKIDNRGATQPMRRETAPQKEAPVPTAQLATDELAIAKRPQDDAPPTVTRPPYTGGAPALRPEQMDAAVVKNNLILRALYGLKDKAPWALKAYSAVTKVLGPIGAVGFFGYNVHNTIKFLKDPKAPAVLKGGIVGATALSGVSAAAAVRVGLGALNVWPMATEGLKAAGRVAGLTGIGAATILSAMDTFSTFRNPKSTAAEKGFSLLGTAAGGGLLVGMALGLTGPFGIALGIGAAAFPLLKGFLGKNKIANKVFETIGEGAKKVGSAVVDGVKSVGKGIAKVFGSL